MMNRGSLFPPLPKHILQRNLQPLHHFLQTAQGDALLTLLKAENEPKDGMELGYGTQRQQD